MADPTSYDVRVYKTEVYKGARVTTHYVRWKVAGRRLQEALPHGRSGGQLPLRAANRRAEGRGVLHRYRAASLLAARRAAEAQGAGLSWYDFVCAYTGEKWPYACAQPPARHRRGPDGR